MFFDNLVERNPKFLTYKLDPRTPGGLKPSCVSAGNEFAACWIGLPLGAAPPAGVLQLRQRPAQVQPAQGDQHSLMIFSVTTATAGRSHDVSLAFFTV